jgi:hypothetical protein
MLIGPDGRLDRSDDARSKRAQGHSAFGDMVVIAIVCACCWLAIGSLVVAALVLGSGWLTPVLVATALLAGAGLVLLRAVHYRDQARLADAALDALLSEASEQTLLDAGAREPGLYQRSERLRLLAQAQQSQGHRS